MKAIAWALLVLASTGCSRDRTADEPNRAAEAQREAQARSSAQEVQEKTALNVYYADARASCETEIRKKLKSRVTIIPESATVRWDTTYLTGERVRTKQRFPASEAFIVSMLEEKNGAGRDSPTQFTCQVVCLNKGHCNTTALKP